jgi:hypothetical protein
MIPIKRVSTMWKELNVVGQIEPMSVGLYPTVIETCYVRLLS